MNIWLQIKIILRLPFPLRNFFYKGQSLSLRKNMLCRDCLMVFDLKPWNKYRDIPLKDFNCPACKSHKIYHSDEVSKAIIDKKPINEILNIICTFEKNNPLIINLKPHLNERITE